MMVALVLANLTNVMANFAGIASSLELFHVSRYISVPLAAAARSGCWSSKAPTRAWRRSFCSPAALYVSYIVSGILVKPDWKEAAIYSVRPVLMLDPGYIAMLIGMVGTSVAPWMQFYLQAAVVEKGITAKEYKESRIEVIVGCIVMTVIAFFIIVACAGAIYVGGAARHQRRRRRRARLEAVRPVRLPAVRRRAVQRLAVRRLHPAAVHRLHGLRRAGLRVGRQPAASRGADLLLAVHAADRGGRGRGPAARISRWSG